MEITIDFSKIHNMDEFYAQLAASVDLPNHFGQNLDALSDVLTGELPRPLRINFQGFDLNKYETFVPLIDMIDELTIEDETLEFNCFFSS